VTTSSKKYLWRWAIAGLVVPILVAIVSYFTPEPPERNLFEETKVSPQQKVIATVVTCLYPTVYVDGFLSLAVTDGGGDSGAPMVATIIFAISALLNAGLYVLVGLVVRYIVSLPDSFSSRAP
jgi:arginine exporter protein ArgO